MDFNLNIPVNVISGKGCVLKNSELLATYGKQCIIATGGNSAKLSGAIDDIKKALEKQNIKYTVYDRIEPNPRIDTCHECGKIARETDAEFIIGIGGGSALDGAKAAAVYARNPEINPEEIYTATKRNKALPIILIGTTAGTGSEVGKVSVLTNPNTGRKKSISPSDCCPSLTFADSSYTCSMPMNVTVSTALDALSHALEGYMSEKCTDIPTMFAEKAIPLIFDGLTVIEKTGKLPSERMREQLYYGSLYAGITLAYCGTAFPHPMGYILTENYSVPHGFACATFMDEFIDRSQKSESEKTKKIMDMLGTDCDRFKNIISKLTALPKIEMTENEIQDYCKRFDIAPKNFQFSPGGFEKSDAIEILREKFLK